MSYQQFRTLLRRLTFGNNSQLTNHHVPNSDKRFRQPTENSLLKKATKKLKLNCTGLSKICTVTNQNHVVEPPLTRHGHAVAENAL